MLSEGTCHVENLLKYPFWFNLTVVMSILYIYIS